MAEESVEKGTTKYRRHGFGVWKVGQIVPGTVSKLVYLYDGGIRCGPCKPPARSRRIGEHERTGAFSLSR